MFLFLWIFVSFFFNDTATTEIYTLSLHDALPISAGPAPGVVGGKNELVAHMNGQKAVPMGDPDAKGTADITLKPRAGKVCFDITFTGLSPDNPFAGHIHKGAKGVAGPIKVPL